MNRNYVVGVWCGDGVSADAWADLGGEPVVARTIKRIGHCYALVPGKFREVAPYVARATAVVHPCSPSPDVAMRDLVVSKKVGIGLLASASMAIIDREEIDLAVALLEAGDPDYQSPRLLGRNFRGWHQAALASGLDVWPEPLSLRELRVAYADSRRLQEPSRQHLTWSSGLPE